MIFPASYPTIPFSVDVPGDQALLPPAIACVKSAIHQYLVQLVHKEGGSGLLLRPFLRWLDNNICAVVAPQVEQVQQTSLCGINKLFTMLFTLYSVLQTPYNLHLTPYRLRLTSHAMLRTILITTHCYQMIQMRNTSRLQCKIQFQSKEELRFAFKS